MYVCVLAVGCGDAALTDYMDDDVPAGTCEDTEGDACETGGAGDACMSTQQCGGDFVCTATFNGDIGTFECQSACIPTMDETQWCMDDAACCDDAASCGPRGYCMIADGVDTGIDSGTDDGGTDSGSTTFGETGTGTESGTGAESSTGGTSG